MKKAILIVSMAVLSLGALGVSWQGGLRPARAENDDPDYYPELKKKIVPILNEYMGRMVPVIQSNGGYVNKFLGDGIMFFYGAPRPNPDHVYFSVADLDAVFARARQLPCRQIDAEIKTQPWGERCFYAQDPFGNGLCFVDAKTLFTGR